MHNDFVRNLQIEFFFFTFKNGKNLSLHTPMPGSKISVRPKVFLTFAALFLFFGYVNYILFHPDSYFLSFFNLKFSVITISQTSLQNFFSGQFCDIAWCVSLYLIIVMLSEKMYLHLADRFILLLLPFVTELLQKFQWMPGTFDWYDLMSYFIVLIIFILLFPHLIFTSYEKV